MNAPRRFWREVSAAATAADADGFGVCLDDRRVRLPGGAPLVVGTRKLAEAIAGEWRAIGHGEPIRPEAIRLTRMAGTMIERIMPDPDATRAALLAIGMNDLICYRAEGALGEEQAAAFDPWIDWMTARGVALRTTTTILPLSQPDAARARMADILASCDMAALAALGVATQAGGSLVLALSLVEGAIAPDSCHALCTLDERHQLRVWGDDAELAAEITRRGVELALAREFAVLNRE